MVEEQLLLTIKSVAKKIKYLSLQAKDNSERWIHNDIGYNFGLSNMHAAVGILR